MDLSFPGARLAFKYQQALWQKKLTLFHTGDLLLSLESIDDYLYLSRTGVGCQLAVASASAHR